MNTSNLKNDYDIFIARYKDSLKLKNGQDNKDKDDIYLKSIAKKVQDENDNDQYDSNIPLTGKGYKAEDKDVNKLINFSITQVRNFKQTLQNNEFPKNVNLINYHGGVWDRMKQVPEGCILCILTPLNRLGFTNVTTFIELKDLKKLINKKTFYDDFCKNPMCYGKTIYNGLFYYADIYFPGQFYYDLLLSTKNDEQLAYNGIFSNTKDNTDKITEFITNKTTTSEGFNKTTFHLSHFLNSITDLGIVLVECCRYLNTNKTFGINEVTIMYRYEHFLNLLNKSVMNPDQNDFNNCDLITSFEKEIYFQPKKESKTNLTSFKGTNSYIGNKTIGISYKEHTRKFKICNDEQIINNFTNINYLNNDLSNDYNFAWKLYIICTENPFEEKAIKFLIDNGVNMNVFFSCAISKLLNDDDDDDGLIKIYNTIISIGSQITGIYLNGIKLTYITENLLIFLKRNNLNENIFEIHLQNTNINLKNLYNLYELFFNNVYKNLKVLDISNNNITQEEISNFIKNFINKNNEDNLFFNRELTTTLDGKNINRIISLPLHKPLQKISLSTKKIDNVENSLSINSNAKTQIQREDEQREDEQRKRRELKQKAHNKLVTTLSAIEKIYSKKTPSIPATPTTTAPTASTTTAPTASTTAPTASTTAPTASTTTASKRPSTTSTKVTSRAITPTRATRKLPTTPTTPTRATRKLPTTQTRATRKLPTTPITTKNNKNK